MSIPTTFNRMGLALKPTPPPIDETDYLSFTANVDNSAIKLTKRYGDPGAISLEYSTDKRKWNTYTIDDIIELDEGNTVYFRGNNSSFNDPVAYYSFAASGSIAASGNVMSLIDKTCQTTTLTVKLPRLFSLCSSLTTAPKLPATILTAYECYSYMFESCTGLITAPELPATTLYNGCYRHMFHGCTSLVNAPELPATTLAQNCYDDMFYDCSNLKDAPRLPAKTLENYCYYGMFNGCSALSSMEVEFTQWGNGQNNWHSYWVQYVNPSFDNPKDGIFRCPKALSTIYGISRIPYGFTVEHTDDFLEFTAEEANSTLRIEKAYEQSRWPAEVELSCEYSTDKVNWQPYTLSTTLTLENVNDKIWMRGTGDSAAAQESRRGYWTYHKFIMTGRISADGDMMMMVRNADGRKKRQAPSFYNLFNGCSALTHTPYCSADSLSDYSFYQLFRDCSSLSSAPVLSATTLANYCYESMFYGCSSLSSAPALPASSLASNCYNGMFWLCTSLTDAPVLPATTLASYCYANMFYGCTSLRTAPTLPATTIKDRCYANMFQNCTSLTTPPELPATTLNSNCYESMFRDCTSLSSAPSVLPATTATQYCYYSMFYGCTSLTDAPLIKAEATASRCYGAMFYGCTSLSSISVDFTTWGSTTNMNNWVANVAASGEFHCPSGLAEEYGNNRIPTGWTVAAS